MNVLLVSRMVRAALMSIVPFISAAGAAAEQSAPSPGLVIAFHSKAADRPALRAALESAHVARLKRWKAEGAIAGYRLFFTRYADGAGWDAMEVLSFRDTAGLARWSAVERTAPGGLAPKTLALVQSIDTTPIDYARGGGGDRAYDPAILVIPYVALVTPTEYLRYLDGYTIPQFNGWIAEGVLDGYDVMTSKFPAGRDWNALIVLRYRNDAALGRRDEIVAKVRARLALDPAWKAISDDKKAVRTEKVLAVADQIAASEAP
jgi:hypothetical protein